MNNLRLQNISQNKYNTLSSDVKGLQDVSAAAINDQINLNDNPEFDLNNLRNNHEVDTNN